MYIKFITLITNPVCTVGGHLHHNYNLVLLHPGLIRLAIFWCTFIAACSTVAHFTLIARMLNSSSQSDVQQRFKLGSEDSMETFDHISNNFGGKSFRQCKWGYGGMTATNSSTQLKSFEKLPTHRAAQFGNWNHIKLQGLGKCEWNILHQDTRSSTLKLSESSTRWPCRCQWRNSAELGDGPPEAPRILPHSACIDCR